MIGEYVFTPERGIPATLFFATLFTLKSTLFQPLDFISYDPFPGNFPGDHPSNMIIIGPG